MKKLILASVLLFVVHEIHSQEVVFTSNKIFIPLSDQWILTESEDDDFKGFVMLNGEQEDPPFLYVIERILYGNNHSEQLFQIYHQVMEQETKYSILSISHKPYVELEKYDHRRVMARFYENGKVYIDHTVLISGGAGSMFGYIVGCRYEWTNRGQMESLVNSIYMYLKITPH
jgi:hypothetical protein